MCSFHDIVKAFSIIAYDDRKRLHKLVQFFLYFHSTFFLIMCLMCLGVSEENIDDFWRMVWQEKMSTIVMTTKLKEVNKVGSYFFL